MKKLKFLLAFFVLSIILNGCKKDVEQKQVEPTAVKQTIKLGNKKNPFSLKNIREIKNKRLQNTAQRTISNPNINVDRVWVYVQFNPEKVTGDILAKLEADADIHIMDIPFANFELYNDDFALDEEKAELLKDGKLYAVYKKNSAMNDLFIAENGLETQFLDELYLPEESESEDVDLYMQALLQAGYTQEEAQRLFGICLFKKPHGHINYFDTEFNSFQPVRGMQVWALFFGIPIKTYTDDNGYYEIPWRFSLGTIMGTKAKNDRVNVKPLDTHGTFLQAVGQIVVNFIVGSVHIEGWKSSCNMKNDIDMNFNGHTQVRFWSHILNAYRLYDTYSANDNIRSAPQQMVCYANWSNFIRLDPSGNPIIPNASTPLLGHINYGFSLAEYILNGSFGQNVNLASSSPNLFNLLTGLLPDMTIGLAQDSPPTFYSSRIMQICFHELSHASQFLQVGNAWYTALQWTEAFGGGNNNVNGNPYGNNNYPNSGYVQLAESWSEFMGTTYENRLYGTLGRKQASSTGPLNGNPYNNLNDYYFSSDMIERESFFFPNDWIPYGFYQDLIDNNNPSEIWDNVSGATINQLYYNFSPNTNNSCDYALRFRNIHPAYNTIDYEILCGNYNFLCW